MLFVIRRKSDGLFAKSHRYFGSLQFARKFSKRTHVNTHIANQRDIAKCHKTKFAYTDCEIVEMTLEEIKCENI